MLRPFPARIITGPRDDHRSDVHRFKVPFFEYADLLGIFEFSGRQSGVANNRELESRRKAGQPLLAMLTGRRLQHLIGVKVFRKSLE